MRRFCDNHPKVTPLRLLPLGLVACLGLAASSALAQPANDDFANAQDLGNAGTGSVIGDNINATEENGEQFIFGVPGGQSVWYSWTSPFDGPVTFTTSGGDFDSLFGVYTGTAVDALSIVGEGYDLVSFSFSQPVTFIVSAGQQYMISVDGYDFGIPQGDISLSWTTNTSGAMAAGDFRFTSALYPVSEYESAPYAINGRMGFIGPRMTVTRTGGHDGRVLVDYTLTSGFYTNLVTLTTSGTNITTVISQGGVGLSTNIDFVTNIVARWRFQDMQWGQLVYLPAFYNWTNIVGNNNNGVITAQTNILNFLPADPGLTCNVANSSGIITDTNTTPPTITTTTTNAFCFRLSDSNIVDSATNFVDYVSTSGTLTFDDFQMSSDILVSVFPTFPGPFPPFATNRAPIVNRYLVATIDNVALDPLETTAIAAPTAISTFNKSVMNILDIDVQVLPIPSDLGGERNLGGGTGTGVVGTNVFNFASATIRCKEDVNGFGAARVYVVRSSADFKDAVSVNYRIDYLYPDNNRHDAFQRSTFPPTWEMPLQAGSEYATPTNPFYYSANTAFTSVSGTLNWGTFDGQVKFFDIPINDDNLVEFNEDILLQLWLPNQSANSCLGYVRTCNLTVLFDEQPAGALDRSFNPDNNADTSPPSTPSPGADDPVNALAIQADGKTVIGGDFRAYTGTGRNRQRIDG